MLAMTVLVCCVCVLQSESPEEGLVGVEPSSLQGRLPLLTRKMRKMCVTLVKKNPLPELSEDLDVFTGKCWRKPGVTGFR